MNRARNGFTLVEVLIVTAILSVTLVVLYTSFQIGMTAYKQTEKNLNESREGDIFLLQFSEELTQSFPYLKSAFEGKRDFVSFPTAVKHYTPQGTAQELCLVTYKVEGGSLLRTEKKLRRDRLRQEPDVTETIFEHLSEFKFQYLILGGDQQLQWRDTWANQPYVGLPRALRLTVKGESFGDEAKIYEILIPHGILLEGSR